MLGSYWAHSRVMLGSRWGHCCGDAGVRAGVRAGFHAGVHAGVHLGSCWGTGESQAGAMLEDARVMLG